MKPNWRATYLCYGRVIHLDFYIKPRKGQEGKEKESLKAFDFANNCIIQHDFDPAVGSWNLEQVTYIG